MNTANEASLKARPEGRHSLTATVPKDFVRSSCSDAHAWEAVVSARLITAEAMA